MEKRFWSKVKKSGGCWEWQGWRYSNGYGGFRVNTQRRTSAHRMAFILTNGDVPDGFEVMHSCHNRSCVNPAHLSVGTHQENIKDRKLSVGEDHYKALLTRSQVEEIRVLYLCGAGTKADIARAYGVGRTVVGNIILNKTYKEGGSL